jgi:hypothetical protein
MNEKPERPSRSPLDVDGVASDLSADEIVDIVREMRQRAYEPKSNARKGRKRANKTRR